MKSISLICCLSRFSNSASNACLDVNQTFAWRFPRNCRRTISRKLHPVIELWGSEHLDCSPDVFSVNDTFRRIPLEIRSPNFGAIDLSWCWQKHDFRLVPSLCQQKLKMDLTSTANKCAAMSSSWCFGNCQSWSTSSSSVAKHRSVEVRRISSRITPGCSAAQISHVDANKETICSINQNGYLSSLLLPLPCTKMVFRRSSGMFFCAAPLRRSNANSLLIPHEGIIGSATGTTNYHFHLVKMLLLIKCLPQKKNCYRGIRYLT